MKNGRKKIIFIAGAVVSVIVILYIVYLGAGGAAPYYLTPRELKAKGETAFGEEVRVGGTVVDGSINWDSWAQKLKFEITDGKERYVVQYQGFIPDSFKNGSEVVIEGSYEPKEGFQARKLLVKCPSKYLPERAINGLLGVLRLEEWLYR